jgi:hypothetical protein
MYNRYIPQQDGSYKRNRAEDLPRPPPNPPKPPVVDVPPPPPSVHIPPAGGNVGGFLRGLIPKNFDTGDLIVVLLLLLMAGDKPEDRNTALMTLALYCFL